MHRWADDLLSFIPHCIDTFRWRNLNSHRFEIVFVRMIQTQSKRISRCIYINTMCLRLVRNEHCFISYTATIFMSWFKGDMLWCNSGPYWTFRPSWWRHQMETFSALLALCVGNSPVTGEFPSQRPVTRSSDVFFYLRLIKRLSKHSRG